MPNISNKITTETCSYNDVMSKDIKWKINIKNKLCCGWLWVGILSCQTCEGVLEPDITVIISINNVRPSVYHKNTPITLLCQYQILIRTWLDKKNHSFV